MPVQVLEDSSWHPGANSVDDPGRLRQGEYQWAQNIVNTGGLISTRQGLNQIYYVAESVPRGITNFKDVNGIEYLVYVLSGTVYALPYPFTGAPFPITGISLPTSPSVRRVHMEVCVQAQSTNNGLGDQQFTDGVTHTDTSLVSLTANFNSDDVGLGVDGPLFGVGFGLTISSVTNPTTVVLSGSTTGTATGVTFTIRNRQGTPVTSVLPVPKPVVVIQDGVSPAGYWDGTVTLGVGVGVQNTAFGDASFTDGVTNTDTSFVSATANFNVNDRGLFITGLGIPDDTVINSVTNSTTIVLNKPTTATATGVHFTLVNRSTGIPIGTWMKWVGDRLWVATGNKVRASDFLNPIQFTETKVLASGGFFVLPDVCTGMGVTVDVKTLLAFTDQTTSTFLAGITDRTQWPTTPDFQKVLFAGIGCVSGRTFVNQYGLSWWMSHDGLIALDSALQTYQSSSIHVRDENMSRSKAGITDWVDKGCGGTYGNFLFFSVPSSTLAVTELNHHTWVMNQGVVNTITRLGPPAWASNWVGINPEQWTTGVFHGVKRCFCLSNDKVTGGDFSQQSTIWEAFIGQREDAVFITDTATKVANDIPCAFETRFYGLSESQYMRFRFAEIDLTEIEGNVHVVVYYCGRRTSYKKILDKHIYARPKGDETVFDPTGFTSIAVPQYRIIRTVTDLYEASDINTDIQTDRTRMIDREFSLLVTWTGKMAIHGLRLFVDPEGQEIEGICELSEDTDRWLDSFGHGAITDTPAPANTLTTALRSQYMATLTPRWVEFPVFDVPTGGVSGVTDVFTCETPVFTPPAGGYASYPKDITITTATAGASLSVTTDGSIPTQTHGLITAGTSTTTVSVSDGTTLKAMAFRTGLNDSPVASGLYTMQAVADPTFAPAGATYPVSDFPKSITIATTTSGANIRWTVDGTVPTVTTGNLISASSGAASVPSGATLKAIAFKSGFMDSGVTSETYIGQSTVATPTLSPAGGAFATFPLSVTVATTTAGAYIRYTTDGSVPTSTVGTLINASSGSASVAAGQTLKAKAFKALLTDSGLASGTYTQTVVNPKVPTPTLTPPSGNYFSGSTHNVTISDTLIGCSLSYTSDGSTPTPTHGTIVHANSVTIGVHVILGVDATITVKAMAFKAGYVNSDIAQGDYDFVQQNPL